VPGDTRRAIIERLWIILFLMAGFVFAVLGPPVMAIPLAGAAGALAVLDAYVHRQLVGGPWLVAAAVFGGLWLAVSVAAGVTGADTGLQIFAP
jgi:hypothetical protein